MYRFIIVLMLITTSYIHAQFWTEVGETLGEIHDKTSKLIQDTVEVTDMWWDEEGEDCFNRVKEEVAESFKSTVSYMKQATAELNTGYTEYWDNNGTPKNERVVFDDNFFDSFLEWWNENGKIYFDYVIDGYKHFVENFKEYREDYYKQD